MWIFYTPAFLFTKTELIKTSCTEQASSLLVEEEQEYNALQS